MKTIGLIGGMTWHSTEEYYRLINEDAQRRLGGSSSARLVLYSLEFGEIEALQEAGDWEKMTFLMIDAAKRIEAAGADFIVICANTMHHAAEAIAVAVRIPLLHIADATAAEIRRRGLKTVGLLGTRYTMEKDFYRRRLEEKHGLAVLIPDEPERQKIHDVIYHELVHGIIREESRQAYIRIIDELRSRGAEGVILGCTEIPLLVKPDDLPIPIFDTTALHAKAAVDLAFSD
jgi:aspartate racemase